MTKPWFMILLCLPLAWAGIAGAQPVTDEDAPLEPEQVSEPEVGEVEALRRELAAQREILEAQQEELEAQRAALERRLAEEAESDDPDAADEDAELASLLEDLGGDDLAPPEEDVVQLHGFMDFGFRKFFFPSSSFLAGAAPSEAGTFVLGNLNIYLDIKPHEDWRGLLELRFTTLPHGEELTLASPAGTNYERVDRFALDVTSPNGRNNVLLGSIIIERAWTEWAPADWLRIRTGYWFTPYGIWNLDHGTPTLISLLLPDSQVVQAFPLQQLGIQFNGTFRRNDWDVQYWAYVSNGRQPAQFDFTEDKAVGGRLQVAHRNRGDSVVMGMSGYWGTYVDVEKEVVGFDPFLIDVERTVSIREWGLGFDLSIDAGNLRSRTELTLRRIDARNGLRRSVQLAPPGTLEPDHYYWNVYTILAYRLPYGFEPFLYYEIVHRPSSIGDTAMVPAVGLNIHFNPQVQLKMQFSPVMFMNVTLPDSDGASENNFQVISARLVMAF